MVGCCGLEDGYGRMRIQMQMQMQMGMLMMRLCVCSLYFVNPSLWSGVSGGLVWFGLV